MKLQVRYYGKPVGKFTHRSSRLVVEAAGRTLVPRKIKYRMPETTLMERRDMIMALEEFGVPLDGDIQVEQVYRAVDDMRVYEWWVLDTNDIDLYEEIFDDPRFEPTG